MYHMALSVWWKKVYMFCFHNIDIISICFAFYLPLFYKLYITCYDFTIEVIIWKALFKIWHNVEGKILCS
jgi:hypothetical protein